MASGSSGERDIASIFFKQKSSRETVSQGDKITEPPAKKKTPRDYYAQTLTNQKDPHVESSEESNCPIDEEPIPSECDRDACIKQVHEHIH